MEIVLDSLSFLFLFSEMYAPFCTPGAPCRSTIAFNPNSLHHPKHRNK